jgi:CTP-dependent riboflavin kinase
MPTIDRFARMFTPETKAEEEMEVEETIKTMCEEGLATTGIPYFLYKEFLEKVKGVSELSLIRVLYRLEKKGYIKREKINNEQVITCKEGVG